MSRRRGSGAGAGRSMWRLTPESSDLLHLDALRIVAALSIVVFHYRGLLQPGSPALQQRLGGLDIFVDLFFVVSGYVMAHVYTGRLGTPEAYGAYLLRRVARLGPLHWLTLAAYVAIGCAAARAGWPVLSQGKYDAHCIAPHVLMLNAFGVCPHEAFNVASWSISAEMGMYVLLPVFLLLAGRPFALGLSILAVVVALTALPLRIGDARNWAEWTYAGGVFRALPSFALGVLLHRLRERLGWIARPELMVLALTAALLGLAGAGAPRLALLPLVYLVVAVAVAADQRGRTVWVTRRLAPFGRLTYSIYMLHLLVQTVAYRYLARTVLHLEGTMLQAYVIVALPLFVAAAAYLSLVLFETPARRFLVGPENPADVSPPRALQGSMWSP